MIENLLAFKFAHDSIYKSLGLIVVFGLWFYVAKVHVVVDAIASALHSVLILSVNCCLAKTM